MVYARQYTSVECVGAPAQHDPRPPRDDSSTPRRMTDTASRAIDEGSSADAAPAALPAGIHVRHLRTHEDFLACVALQDETWGAGFSERVPMAILKVSQRIGGVAAG